MGISSGGKVSCVVQGCNFETPIASDGLFEHCRANHQWRDYPCPEENCKFVAYSKTALKSHVISHSRSPKTHHEFACSKQNCKWTFENNWKLKQHENTHDNILLKCIYCPYTCIQEVKLSMHHRVHFNIRDFKCNICDKTYKQQNELNMHFNAIHSGFVTKCFMCDFEGGVDSVRQHLRNKHGKQGYRWDAKKETFVKM